MTMALVQKLKDNDQDFEFYPTTTRIINTIRKCIGTDNHPSILDCGAGNGETLKALAPQGRKYAIEKSKILVNEMSEDIFIVGCEFFENSIIDKKVDIVFSNPPYSQYVEWATRIITEANASEIFLVIPSRWKKQLGIKAAIASREAKCKVVGTTSFLDGERAARAKVDILRINLQPHRSRHNTYRQPDIDPFDLWVEKEFPLNDRKEDSAGAEAKFREKLEDLVPVRGRVPALVTLYQDEMRVLQENFRSISQLDPAVFAELDVNFKSISEFLRNRIKGLKEKYWRELFSHFDPITSRLTSFSRKDLLEVLNKNVSVDFNESNIYAVTSWAIKNANKFFDSQLIKVFNGLLEEANLVRYKSNKKTWGSDQWRFNQDLRAGKIKNIGLDYRCVICCHNTFSRESYMRYDYENGLHTNVNEKLNDILTVARNLGFDCPSWEDSNQKQWEPGKAHNFYINRGKKQILMSVRAYRNGNIHVKFNQAFLRKLNVEFGRLKGWLRDYQQAAEELNIPKKEAKKFFKTNFILEGSSVKLLAA